MSTSDTQSKFVLAAALNVGCLFVISIQDLIVKLLSDQYAMWQFCLARAVIGSGCIAVVLAITKQWHHFKAHQPLFIILRGTFSFAAYVCYFLSLAALSLTVAVAIMFLAPLMVTALSVPILKEKVGLHRWSAVITGFIGLVIIVRPDIESIQPAILLGLASALFYALRLLIARLIPPADSSATISMYSFATASILTVIGTAISSVADFGPSNDVSFAFLNRDWAMPGSFHLFLILSTGVVTAIGHVLSIQAYRTAPASFVSVFEYSYFVWAILFGYVFWQETPDALTLLGISILVGAGLYITWRERRQNQPQKRPIIR